MPRSWPYCPPRRGRTTFSYMYLLLYQLIFKHRPPSLRPSQYSTASINTPVEIRRRRRRKSQTSEKYYQIRCSLILYLYLQIWHNSAVTNSRRLNSTAQIALISLRTLYEGSFALPYKDSVRTGLSSSSYPAHAAMHCSFAHNILDRLTSGETRTRRTSTLHTFTVQRPVVI